MKATFVENLNVKRLVRSGSRVKLNHSQSKGKEAKRPLPRSWGPIPVLMIIGSFHVSKEFIIVSKIVFKEVLPYEKHFHCGNLFVTFHWETPTSVF
jgi:hypothetical protein